MGKVAPKMTLLRASKTCRFDRHLELQWKQFYSKWNYLGMN